MGNQVGERGGCGSRICPSVAACYYLAHNTKYIQTHTPRHTDRYTHREIQIFMITNFLWLNGVPEAHTITLTIQ